MTSVDTDFIREVKELENVIFVCFGKPKGDELPQVVTPDDVVIDMVSRRTGKSLELADAAIHNQIDPSYEGDAS